MNSSMRPRFPFLFLMCVVLVSAAFSQQFDPGLFAGMKWRLLGPFRGGRSVAVTGVPGHPDTFYFGAVGGGVWKTENAGQTWAPIFDSQPIASIGAVAVAPSDPNVIYVGSGEADMRSQISYGDGMYKSVDAGKTWTHIGLQNSQQVGRILVDPHDPNTVFVAVLGHAYAANSERGVFRSTDGGQNWQKVLFKDDNSGAIDLAADPRDSHVIYATLWQTRRPPWNVYPPSKGPGSGLYKSTDGGSTWRQIIGNGFPGEDVGRIGVAVAPSNPNRVYAIVDAKEGGLYRSDDAGKTWKRADAESRIWGRGWYFGQVAADPKDPNTVYVMNTSMYRSRDGGQTFIAIKGAPGGDDYHQLWIDPDNPSRMALSSDQGVVVSVDGAQNWSSWYNQATAQLYHVTTDTAFPYRIYAAQQDSGAVMVPSRGEDASISFRDWKPICAGNESSYIATDPANPNVIFGDTVDRCDQLSNINKNVSPALGLTEQFRHTWTLPLVFSPTDPYRLYFSHQVLFESVDLGQSWKQISPDLTRENPGVPPNLDPATVSDVAVTGPRRGVIYTIAPSPLKADMIWVGTDDGQIELTRDDGKSWGNVTPPDISAWNKVAVIEASHFDLETAYAAVDRHRLDDFSPYIYRTHDGGKTWQKITAGLPPNVFVNVVREDPVRRGLLFAGTETAAYVSFSDGNQWQSLQLNLPPASVRDFSIHGDDLIAATHGRSIWTLDDIMPLRQITAEIARSAAYLFQPASAIRIRTGRFDGTPLPLGTPVGQNPPTGAIIDYRLQSTESAPVTLEIFDSKGQLARRFASTDKLEKVDPKSVDIPEAWLPAPKPLEATAGMHRFVWDLHYSAPRTFGPTLYYLPAAGPLALPGNYTVKLTVAGRTYIQPLTVLIDPRVTTPPAELQQEFLLASDLTSMMSEVATVRSQADNLRKQVQEVRPRTNSALTATLDAFDHSLLDLMGTPARFFGEDTGDRTSLQYLARQLRVVDSSVDGSDAPLTAGDRAACDRVRQIFSSTISKWNELKTAGLAQINSQLQQAGLHQLHLSDLLTIHDN
jgi:photosystem II stability/assembly factor-like uncharacterized protein